MGKGGGSAPTQQNVSTTTSNLPEYARPYYENLVNRAQAQSYQEYQPYPYERIADFTPAQQQVQQSYLNMGSPEQFATGSGLATAAGLGALQAANYTPGEFTTRNVTAPQAQAAQMQAAQTGYSPELVAYQMANPEMFGMQQTQQYMSPYIQAALEPQMREAATSAKRAQLVEDLGAARQGSYGGSRQLLAGMERERNLQQQMGDIYGRGMQSAFENAQQQFERDRAAGMQAGQTNLQARLGVQQLGVETGLRTALANLDAESQARVQNMAAENQMRGMNAEQALRAALANQQSDLEAQRLAEASRQFGAQQELAGLTQAGQMAQTLGNLGQYQQTADLQRLGAQGAAAGQEQAMEQQRLDELYADFLRQRDYPMEQLGYFSNILRGLPLALSSTQTTYAPPPSTASQVLGTGLGALGMAKTLGG